MHRSHTESGLTVETENGVVQGVVTDGMRTWRGIPFAAPPVGERRFLAPQRASDWEGVRNADEFSPLPIQKRGFEPIGGASKSTPMSEDCLSINVSAPLNDGKTPRPVVVWIYGGGFLVGGTRTPLYRGDDLINNGDVIYVSFNYRVGVFGFTDFSTWSTPNAPIDSNLGLRDQVAALEWVHRNIAAFGGDPNRVTIVGQSAGAMSVVSLMCIPATDGLFHRAFAMSPAGGSAFGPEPHKKWATEVIKRIGLDPADKANVSSVLKTMPAEELSEKACHYFFDIAPDEDPGRLPTCPLVDGDFLPQAPVAAFQNGAAHRVPLIIGTMSREGAMLDKILPVIASKPERLDKVFRRNDWGVRERIAKAYPGYPSKETAIDVAGDFTFWQPSILIADGHSKVAPCWVYRFDYATPVTKLVFKEATHGLDLPMLFGAVGEGSLGLFDLFSKRASRAVSRRYQGVFLDFVRGDKLDWPAYNVEKRQTLIFDRHDRVEDDPRQERRNAWADFVVS